MTGESERLARIEAKQDAITDLLNRFIHSQEKHNDAFYKVRDKINEREANAKGAWFTIGLFGSLTIAVSGFVSWAVSTFRGIN